MATLIPVTIGMTIFGVSVYGMYGASLRHDEHMKSVGAREENERLYTRTSDLVAKRAKVGIPSDERKFLFEVMDPNAWCDHL